MTQLTEQFFKNRQEQNKIKLALTEAMPVGVYYHNMIIALTDLLVTAVNEAYKDEVYKKWKPEEEQS
jgi:hypothetical protein